MTVLILQWCMCDSNILVKHSLYLYDIDVSAQICVHLDVSACVSVRWFVLAGDALLQQAWL